MNVYLVLGGFILLSLFIRINIINYLSTKYLGKKIFNTENVNETALSMLDLVLIGMVIISFMRAPVYTMLKNRLK